MTNNATRRLLCALLVFITMPAWAGSIGLQLGSSGHLTFREKKAAVWGGGTIVDFGAMPAVGHFSFITGRLSSSTSNQWLFGSGGHVSFSGCLDLTSDNDKPGNCDKKDFHGSLFTGYFKKAKILKTGANTFTLSGQLWLTPASGLVKQMGVSAAPFLANISLKFTDTCVPSSSANCKANILGGKLFATAPEPTAFMLLGLGMVLAGLGDTTLLSLFRSQA
jgi:hypothetical protein